MFDTKKYPFYLIKILQRLKSAYVFEFVWEKGQFRKGIRAMVPNLINNSIEVGMAYSSNSLRHIIRES